MDTSKRHACASSQAWGLAVHFLSPAPVLLRIKHYNDLSLLYSYLLTCSGLLGIHHPLEDGMLLKRHRSEVCHEEACIKPVAHAIQPCHGSGHGDDLAAPLGARHHLAQQQLKNCTPATAPAAWHASFLPSQCTRLMAQKQAKVSGVHKTESSLRHTLTRGMCQQASYRYSRTQDKQEQLTAVDDAGLFS